ncbi:MULTISPECIES: CU044_5270 family protein [Streptomyces]|uniref:CU044_5270 family protein n=2 Tax=Streptomyces TaxID=1883 RepID=A0ABV9IMZ9_9ACTN
MNSTPSGAGQEEREELVELARLLPAGAVEHGLPAGRRSHYKDVLMQTIDQDSTMGDSLSRPRRFSRPVLIAASVAVAVAATLTVRLGTGDSGSHRGTAAPSAAGQKGRGVVVTLDRIAAVAMKSGVEPVKASQFAYVRTRTAENEADWGQPVKPGPLHDREVWLAQEPGPMIDFGLTRENGEEYGIRILVPKGSAGEVAGIDRPTYAWLASLPTDPAKLLQRLYAETPAEGDEDQDQAVFERIGELISAQYMPSATAAAIYRATARIPGVTVLNNAVDAAGRHGIAIARENTRMGLRTEWIFDPETLGFLGERSVLTRNTVMGPAGTVEETTAVLERAVVDKKGQEPGSAGSGRS